MNTSFNNTVCPWVISLTPAIDMINYITYTILPFPTFVLGMTGHLIALVAFTKQRKTEAAYAYQVFVTVTKTYEIVCYNIWILFFYQFADQDWSAQRGDSGWVWFKSSYALMWFTARVTTILQSSSITLTVLATTAMAADRVFGLWKPVAYKAINKKKHQLLAYASCCGIQALLTVDTIFRWTVADGIAGHGYKLVPDTYAKTNFGVGMAQVRSGIRLAAEFVLAVCSAMMIRLYKIYLSKANAMTSRNNAQEETRKAIQRTLFNLALFQTLSTAVPILVLAVYAAGPHVSGNFLKCGGQVLAVVVDFALLLVSGIDFYLLYLLNNQFRQMVQRSFKKSTAVVAAAT